jgi:hypothetical protein
METRTKRTVRQTLGKCVLFLFWALVIGYGCVGAFFVWTAGGWLLVGGCWLWSASIWWLSFRLLQHSLTKRALEGLPTPRFSALFCFLLVVFGLTVIGPGILATVKWGPDVGCGMALLGVLAPVSLLMAYLLFKLPEIRRTKRHDREREQFEAQFPAGPIGVWRANLAPAGIDMEPGCQVTFQGNGDGRFRQWQTKADESTAPERPFQWKLLEKGVIEVNCDDENRSERLSYFFLCWGNSVPLVVRLILKKKEAMDRTEQMADDEALDDDSYWPGVFFFAYLGEPPNDDISRHIAA